MNKHTSGSGTSSGTVVLYAPSEKKVYHGDVEIDGERVLVVVEDSGGAMNLPLAWCVILWGNASGSTPPDLNPSDLNGPESA